MHKNLFNFYSFLILTILCSYCYEERSFMMIFLWLQGDTEENRVRERSAIRSRGGFHGLSQSNVNETEDQQREKEHNDVKVFFF